jgi:hypothetical protein
VPSVFSTAGPEVDVVQDRAIQESIAVSVQATPGSTTDNTT